MSELINKTSNSVKWTTINTIFNSAVQPFYRIGLALLLSPTEYGYLSVILLIISTAELLNNLGVGEVLIREDRIGHKETSTLFYFNLLMSISFSIIFYSFSGKIAEFYGYRNLEEYIKLLSFVVLINGSTSIFKFYLHKYFEFKTTSLLLIGRFAIEIIISVSLLFLGFGLNGVVLGIIFSHTFYSILLSAITIKFYKYKIEAYFSTAILKRFLVTGIKISFQRILNFSSNKIDEILIGKLFGANILGQYYLAKSILFQMQSLLSRSFGQVMLPFFSSFKGNTEQIKIRYMQMLKMLLLIGTSLFLAIFFFSDYFIMMFLSEEWFESIYVFKLLVFPTFLMFLNAGLTSTVMISMGRIGIILLIDIISTFLFLSAVLILDFNVVVNLIITYTIYIYFRIALSKISLWRTLNINLLTLLSNFWRSILVFIITGTIFYVSNEFFIGSSFLDVIYIVLIVGITFILLNILFNKSTLLKLLDLFKRIVFS